MLSATGDWYRLITVSLNDEHLKNRRASASRLVERLKTLKPGALLAFVSFALQAVGSPRKSVPELEVVLSAMLEDEPSLDRTTISETRDPAICAAIAVGEFLNLSLTPPKQRHNQICAALAVISAVQLRPGQSGQYVDGRITGLLTAAEAILHTADTRRRDRKDTAVGRFNKNTEASATGDLLAQVRAVIGGLHEEMLKDREELQALWWVFGQYSPTINRYYKDMGSGTAGALAGLELGQIVSSPATRGFSALAERVAGAAPHAGEKVQLLELLQALEPVTWAALRPTASSAEVVKSNQTLFPILSLAVELEGKGDLSAFVGSEAIVPLTHTLSAKGLATQVYTERSLLSHAVMP